MTIADIVKKVKIMFPDADVIDIVDLANEFIETYSFEKEYTVYNYGITLASTEKTVKAFPSNILTILNMYVDGTPVIMAQTYLDYINNASSYYGYINNRTITFKEEETGTVTCDAVMQYDQISDLSTSTTISVGNMTSTVIAMYIKYNLAIRANRPDWKILYETFEKHYANISKRKDVPSHLVIHPNTSPV